MTRLALRVRRAIDSDCAEAFPGAVVGEPSSPSVIVDIELPVPSVPSPGPWLDSVGPGSVGAVDSPESVQLIQERKITNL